ncbi:hypothetical protein [Hyphococcus sp.]|uniref:hypothetical protein n=1 Tax=Hyphococcus sp. TaxID=2038636 RepID=UPI002080E161|nr:MAG: hypothetical protein DHS20C04_14590 [Marinicaulis sp.]
MTELYAYRGLGPALDIHCPKCGGEARFESDGGVQLPVLHADPHDKNRPPVKSWAGKYVCNACAATGAHDLSWPGDAYYQVDYRGETLSAHTRKMMEDIRDYIAASADRHATRKSSAYFVKLVLIPKEFLSAKARAPILKKIDALLERSMKN